MNRKQIHTIKKYSVMGIPIVALLVGFYIPTGSVIVFSFWESTALWMEPGFTFAAYESIFTQNLDSILLALEIAAAVGVLTGVFGFIVGYYATFMTTDFKRVIMLSILAIPFVVNELVRTLMWVPVLGQNGFINNVLVSLGIIQSPLEFLMLTNFGVVLVSASTYLPFVIFTSWLSMELIDKEKLAAAMDLGSRPLNVVLTVVVPLSIAGIAIGVAFAFAATIGNADIPFIIGGTNGTSIGRLAEDAFSVLNPPKAAALATLTLVGYTVALLILSQRADIADIFTAEGDH